jgi:hypothetical protein
MVQRLAFSSLGRSVASFLPNEPAPAEGQSLLESGNLYGIPKWAAINPPVKTEGGYRTGIVSRANRMTGDRELYSRGMQRNSLMEMVSTGQVERSRFQPLSGHTYVASFNDNLYRSGGYPQNLGLSFKASGIPDGVATSSAWGRMRARPQYTRTIFTRRRFSVAPALPAQPRPS